MSDLAATLAAIRTVRITRAGQDERAIHEAIGGALAKAGISFRMEARIAPRCRVDILTASGIAIEVKKDRPPTAGIIAQARRYAAVDAVRAVVVVLERNVAVPPILEGKPVEVVSLNALWGVSL